MLYSYMFQKMINLLLKQSAGMIIFKQYWYYA